MNSACRTASNEKIIFNGPVKGKEQFLDALKNQTIVNLDAKRELEWLKECSDINAKIGLRVNFDLEKLCPNESQCGLEDGRFGFSYECGEFDEALKILMSLNVKLLGIHLHCSSKTRSLNIYRAIAKMAVEIVDKYQLQLDYVDIGGGFFGGVTGKPSFDDYFKMVKEIFNQTHLLDYTIIIVEPGMALIGASVDYVTSVIDVKETPHNHFVTIDGSRIHIDPLMRKTGYTHTIAYNGDVEPNTLAKQTISGFTCMENDRLFTLVDHQALKVGDRIVFEKVGAYTMCLSPLFIQFYPEIYVKTNSEYILARKKISASDFNNLGR